MSDEITVEDIVGPNFSPEEEIPRLQDLIAQNLRQLKSLYLATQSRRYRYGRNNITVEEARKIEVAEKTREHDPDFNFLEVLSEVLSKHKPLRGCNRTVIRGPFDIDVLIDLHAICRYLVDNGRDFNKVESGDYTEIRCSLPGIVQTPVQPMQMVCDTNKKTGMFIAGYTGCLPNGKQFCWYAGHDPKFVLGSIYKHPNEFLFHTEGKEVHLNGPGTNPVIKDLLTLAKSVIKYAKSMIEEGK